MKRIWMFIAAALIVSIALAVFASPFASGHPDGLEKVAEDEGFIDQAADEQDAVWKGSPAPDYAMPGVRSDSVATALAGLAGTVATFGVALLLAKLMRRHRRAQTNTAS